MVVVVVGDGDGSSFDTLERICAGNVFYLISISNDERNLFILPQALSFTFGQVFSAFRLQAWKELRYDFF